MAHQENWPLQWEAFFEVVKDGKPEKIAIFYGPFDGPGHFTRWRDVFLNVIQEKNLRLPPDLSIAVYLQDVRKYKKEEAPEMPPEDAAEAANDFFDKIFGPRRILH